MKSAPARNVPIEQLPVILLETLLGIVRRPDRDLSARQLATLLICYLEDGSHTVRALADRLNVAKPTITRALDRLEEFDLARRVPDPADRRSILIGRTRAGRTFVSQVARMMDGAARDTASRKTPAAAGRG
jgi:DNA-binding MarR family transcriptional regulator